jgi:hypothetical protein
LHPEVAEVGFQALNHLLARLTGESNLDLVWLTDDEMAQLTRSGTSCAVRGANLVVRNYSHSHKMIPVPEATVIETSLGTLPALNYQRSALMLVEPQQTLVLPLQPTAR